MNKITLSIQNKEKIARIKSIARTNKTSLSRMFENYIDMLISFDRMHVRLSKTLRSLRQPGKRPNDKEIERHLARKRHRS